MRHTRICFCLIAIRQIPMENSKVLSALLRSFMGAEQRGLLQTKIDKRDSIHSFNRGSTKRKWVAICISRSLRLSCICSDREASLGFCSAAKASFFHWFSGYMVIGKNNNRFPVSSDFPWAVQTHTHTHTIMDLFYLLVTCVWVLPGRAH